MSKSEAGLGNTSARPCQFRGLTKMVESTEALRRWASKPLGHTRVLLRRLFRRIPARQTAKLVV